MIKKFWNSSRAQKVRVVNKWIRPLLVVASLGFCLWFFYAVHEERNRGSTIDGIGDFGDNSKRIRTELRTWFRQAFPASAARSDERFGIFEFGPDNFSENKIGLVILAHGLDEPGNIWANLAPVLAEKGYKVIEIRYPNDQPIHESSQFLKKQLDDYFESVDSVKPAGGIHLIGHSMGGLVFRNFITQPDLYQSSEWSNHAQVLSLVQLGTPNHGSWLATYRLPAELRDHLFKDFGLDAMLGMLWDGAGEAQIDLKPGSTFLEALNSRPFPKDIYWVGVAGTGSPVDLSLIQNGTSQKLMKVGESAGRVNDTFPELFKGTGDGCVSVDSLRCSEMNDVYYVEATHRNMIRGPRESVLPAIPIVLEVLERN